MEEEEDLTLPEDDTEADSKTSFGEQREPSEKQKKILKKQKEFELGVIEGGKKRKEEELKEKKKEDFFKWVVVGGALLLLIGLYFWLVY